MRRTPIRWQILGGFMVLEAFILAFSLTLIEIMRTRELEAEIDRQLRAAVSVFDSLLGRQQELLMFEMNLLSKDFAFKSAFATRDRGTIHSAAANLKDRIGASTFWVVDKKGRLIANVSDHTLGTENLKNVPILPAALTGQAGAGVEMIDGRISHLVAVPLEAPQVVGVLIAGFDVGPAFAQELKRVTLSDVSFGVHGRIVTTTLDDSVRVMMERHPGILDASRSHIIGESGHRQVILVKSLGNDMTAYLQRSWEGAVKPLRRLQRYLFLIGVVGLLLTGLLGYLIAEGITASMQRLVEQLQAANESLTRINGFQTKFFAMVAHDVRNPVTVLSMYTKILCEGIKDERLLDFARRMLQALTTINFLVSDLVDFAAIENGLLRMNLNEMDLKVVIGEIKSRLELTAQNKKIHFIVPEIMALPRISADAQRIAQVLQNLCSNALQYTPAGGRVTLTAAAVPEGVRISVDDTGIGLAPRDLKRIFNRFFQADNGRQMRAGGFGLGLKIAREIVQAHGASLEIRSELGKGSTFFFTLPLSPPAAKC